MRKTFVMALGVILVMILGACGGNKVEGELADQYIAKAEEIVTLLNDANYEEVHTKFNDEMKAGLPVDAMDELTPVIEEAGNFEKIDKSSVEEIDDLYTVILVAKYSDKNRTYTITFNKDEEVAGLYIK